MKFVDLLLYSEEEIGDFERLYTKHKSNLGYLENLPDNFNVLVIQHADFAAEVKRGRVSYRIVKAKNDKWALPLRLFRQIKSDNPDVILVHSMIFAWQIFFLGLFKDPKTKILVQNHAEKPGGRLRQLLEKLAARYIDGFLFVNKMQANPWKRLGIITDEKKVFEVMEGSTYFEPSKNGERPWGPDFLWVGRLDKNKDPLTILSAFLTYSNIEKKARLKMIFNAGNLLSDVHEFIKNNKLDDCVQLQENIPHHLMQEHYFAADYFILGSHDEGSGYALCEAMACGCVPIVTDIPSFNRMVSNGKEGYLFPKGDDRSLLQILKGLNVNSHLTMRKNTLEKFKQELSFAAIARKIVSIAENVHDSGR